MCDFQTTYGSGILIAPRDLEEHIYGFYRALLGEEGDIGLFSLAPDFWHTPGRVAEEENDGLMLTFTGSEMDVVLSSMKVDTAVGPDGFPIIFFKRFWTLARPYILAIPKTISSSDRKCRNRKRVFRFAFCAFYGLKTAAAEQKPKAEQ